MLEDATSKKQGLTRLRSIAHLADLPELVCVGDALEETKMMG